MILSGRERAMHRPEDVSLVVPVYDGGSNWLRVLDALSALEPPPGEFIIVDDGSLDGSKQAALARGLDVSSTPSPRSGPAIARNLGAAHARGELLYFVDADVLVPRDAVARVLRSLEDESVSAIFGSYDDAPEDPAFVSQYKNLMHHYVHQTSNPEATSFWAGCGAVRRDVFRALGGFSTAYKHPSIEDIELGYRLRATGGRIRLVKDLQVKHLKRWTLRSLLVTDVRFRALPWAELLARRQDLPRDLNLQTAHQVSAVLCWLLLLILGGLLISPLFLVPILGICGSLVALNLGFYRFLLDKRGVWFTLRALPLHWLYYLYSSAAFAYVMVSTPFQNLRSQSKPVRF